MQTPQENQLPTHNNSLQTGPIPLGNLELSHALKISRHPLSSEKILIQSDIILSNPCPNPKHAIFVIDVSGSMENVLTQMKESIQWLIENTLGLHDEVSLISFSNKAEVILRCEKVANKKLIHQKIQSLEAKGRTRIERGLALIDATLVKNPQDAFIFLLTDGGNDKPFKGNNQNTADKAFNFDSVEKLNNYFTNTHFLDETDIAAMDASPYLTHTKIIDLIKKNCNINTPIPIIPVGLGDYNEDDMLPFGELTGVPTQIKIRDSRDLERGFEVASCFMKLPLHRPSQCLRLSIQQPNKPLQNQAFDLGVLLFNDQPKSAVLEYTIEQPLASLKVSAALIQDGSSILPILEDHLINTHPVTYNWNIIALFAEKSLLNIVESILYVTSKNSQINASKTVTDLHNLLKLFNADDSAYTAYALTVRNNIQHLKSALSQQLTATIREIDSVTRSSQASGGWSHHIKVPSFQQLLTKHCYNAHTRCFSFQNAGRLNSFRLIGNDINYLELQQNLLYLPISYTRKASLSNRAILIDIQSEALKIQQAIVLQKIQALPKTASNTDKITTITTHYQTLFTALKTDRLTFYAKYDAANALFKTTELDTVHLDYLILKKAVLTDDLAPLTTILTALSMAHLIREKQLDKGSIYQHTKAYTDRVLVTANWLMYTSNNNQRLFINASFTKPAIYPLNNAADYDALSDFLQQRKQSAVLEDIVIRSDEPESISLQQLIDKIDPDTVLPPNPFFNTVNQLLCPIFCCFIKDPVTIEGQPSHVFERAVIQYHFDNLRVTNPLTNEACSTKLIPHASYTDRLIEFLQYHAGFEVNLILLEHDLGHLVPPIPCLVKNQGTQEFFMYGKTSAGEAIKIKLNPVKALEALDFSAKNITLSVTENPLILQEILSKKLRHCAYPLVSVISNHIATADTDNALAMEDKYRIFADKVAFNINRLFAKNPVGIFRCNPIQLVSHYKTHFRQVLIPDSQYYWPLILKAWHAYFLKNGRSPENVYAENAGLVQLIDKAAAQQAARENSAQAVNIHKTLPANPKPPAPSIPTGEKVPTAAHPWQIHKLSYMEQSLAYQRINTKWVNLTERERKEVLRWKTCTRFFESTPLILVNAYHNKNDAILLKKTIPYLPNNMLSSMSLLGKMYLADSDISKLMMHIVHGNIQQAKIMITDKKNLLLQAGAAETPGGDLITGTPLEAALRLGDNHMAVMISEFLKKKDILVQGKKFIHYLDQITEQSTYDFEGLLKTIVTSSEADIDAAQNRNMTYKSPLQEALTLFRKAFAPSVKEDFPFNYQNLSLSIITLNEYRKTCELQNLNNPAHLDAKKSNLYWTQVYGFLLRRLPACDMQWLLTENTGLNQYLNSYPEFKGGITQVFPKTAFDDHYSGLGYEYAYCMLYGGKKDCFPSSRLFPEYYASTFSVALDTYVQLKIRALKQLIPESEYLQEIEERCTLELQNS